MYDLMGLSLQHFKRLVQALYSSDARLRDQII